MQRAPGHHVDATHGHRNDANFLEAPPIVTLQHTFRCVLATATAFATACACADDGLYIGAAAAAAFYEVDYHKSVDSRNPLNVSSNTGQIFFAADSADDTTWDAGLLLGYRLGFGPVTLDLEGDFVSHSGTASGRLPGAGSSPERNQLGEVWPEDWSLAKDRSYGITARLGTGFFAPLGARIYVFGGMRRLEADFKTAYTGCLLFTACAGRVHERSRTT